MGMHELGGNLVRSRQGAGPAEQLQQITTCLEVHWGEVAEKLLAHTRAVCPRLAFVPDAAVLQAHVDPPLSRSMPPSRAPLHVASAAAAWRQILAVVLPGVQHVLSAHHLH